MSQDNQEMAGPEGNSPPETPTLDRIGEVREKSQAVGEFIGWLSEMGYTIAVPSNRKHEGHRDCLEQATVSRNDLLHQFFGIDREKENQEREALLQYIRATQAQRPGQA